MPHNHVLAEDLQEEVKTLETLSKVIDIAGHVGKFDERVLFRGENANVSDILEMTLRVLIIIILRLLGLERRVQSAFPERFKDHGLRWM